MQGMFQWRIKADQDPEHDRGDQHNQFCLTACGKVFQVRPGVPCKLGTVSLSKGFKPTQLEMYMLLSQRNWRRRQWQGKPKALKEKAVTANEKLYYHQAYFYWLCLLNIQEIADVAPRGFKLFHGQAEGYYQTAFQLAQKGETDLLKQLKPGKAAATYRSPSCTGNCGIFCTLQTNPHVWQFFFIH